MNQYNYIGFLLVLLIVIGITIISYQWIPRQITETHQFETVMEARAEYRRCLNERGIAQPTKDVLGFYTIVCIKRKSK